MINTLKQHPRAVLFSVLLHAGIIVLALIEFSGDTVKPLVSKQGQVDQTIKAEVIDQKKLDERAEEIKKQQQQKKKQQEQKRRKEQAAKKREQELNKKKAQEKRKKEQAQKKAAEQKQRKLAAEKKKKAAELKRKKQAEEKRKKAEAERKKQEQARLKAEAEKKRKAEEAKRKAELERKKQEEARLKAQREARLKAEAEQRRKEAELKAQLAAEERQRVLDSQKNRYYRLIRDKITRNWRQPVNAGSMPECEVRVIQGPGGVILDVEFGNCPGTREYRLSVEKAVLKSDPLPNPEDPELFDRELSIQFKPK